MGENQKTLKRRRVLEKALVVGGFLSVFGAGLLTGLATERHVWPMNSNENSGNIAVVSKPILAPALPRITPEPITLPTPTAALPTSPAEVRSEPPSVLYDVPLSEDLQEHITRVCEKEDVPVPLILAMIERESSFRWHEPKMDANGLESVGYMQINSINWDYLSELGKDVHTEKGNIEAGVYMIARLLEKYPVEKALMCYNMGEYGASRWWKKGVTSTSYTEFVMGRSTEYEGGENHDRY